LEKPTREQLEERLRALSEDALDNISRYQPEGFDLGVVGILFEVRIEREGSDYLKRSAAGYTPDDDVSSYWTYWCSDHRGWVQEKAFQTAYELAQGLGSIDTADEESDDDEESEEPEEPE
jgi:hypothetical protein